MKRIATLALLAVSAVALSNCANDPPPPPVHVHHYHSTTRTKSASVSGGGYTNSPEGFQAVTPPASYSR